MTAPLNGRELLYNAYTQDQEKCRKEIKDIQSKAAAEKQTRTDAAGIYTAPNNIALTQIRVLYVQNLSTNIFGVDANKRAALMRYLLEKLRKKPSDLPLPECWAKLFDKIVDPAKGMKSDKTKKAPPVVPAAQPQAKQAVAQPAQLPPVPQAATKTPPMSPPAPPQAKPATVQRAKLPSKPVAKAPPKVPVAQPQVKQAAVPALRVALNPQPAAVAQNQLTVNHLQQALANIAPNQVPPQQVQAPAQAMAPAPLPAAQQPLAAAAANAPTAPAQNDGQKVKAAAPSTQKPAKKSSGFVGFLKRCRNMFVQIVTYPFRLLKMLFTSNKQK
ncbi:MAG: hypothetical protein LLG04_11340 [Parachlamydia sp.]|nr:hypothetical protein [Parachlamydia sp.]